MNIGIIGAGRVGTTLGDRLAKAGHDISYAVEQPDAPEHQLLRDSGAYVGATAEVVRRAGAVLLATPWGATEEAVMAAGDFGGKPLMDVTNPIDANFELAVGHDASGAEQVQRWVPSARVVKVFNTTGQNNMAEPVYPSGPLVMLACGDDTQAVEVAMRLAADVGFEPFHVGPLTMARYLEPAAMLWIKTSMKHGRDFGFGLYRREKATQP